MHWLINFMLLLFACWVTLSFADFFQNLLLKKNLSGTLILIRVLHSLVPDQWFDMAVGAWEGGLAFGGSNYVVRAWKV